MVSAQIGLTKEKSDPQSVPTDAAVMVTAAIRDLLSQVCSATAQICSTKGKLDPQFVSTVAAVMITAAICDLLSQVWPGY